VTLRRSVGSRLPAGRSRALCGVALAALIAASGGAYAQEQAAGGGLVDLVKAQAPAGDARMLVEADSVLYDIDSQSIAAVGKVVIYYGAYTLLADRVDVDRRTKRVTATGSVELSDGDGNVVRGDSVDLTDDLRDGVAEGLELVTADRVAFTARKATRAADDVTTFEEGVYQPCVDCNGEKGRKPIWQIRANRIIHRQGERTITFEDAKFEFLGVPIAWVPRLTQPDPSVKRLSGFLMARPTYSEKLGFGLSVPYFWALAPNTDVTFSPGYYTRQGAFADLEFRHRTIDGAWSIRLAGLNQSDPSVFGDLSGNRDWRGGVLSKGEFALNERWKWGWNIGLATDRSFFSDYDLPAPSSSDAVTNELYLTGVDGRNRFDAHAYGFFVQQEDSTEAGALPQDLDLQSKQALAVPVIDHQVYAPEPVLGGDFSVTSNFTTVTRQRTDVFEYSDGTTRLRGPAGTYSRGSIDALWRRRFVDGIGQVFTPFAYFRGDVFFSAPKGDGVSSPSSETEVRAMPAVGLEYSYPIQILSPVGSHVIEPVAQLIVRPSETETASLANDDAQSLVFDANSLFDYDKFSGYDRVEGGTRANLGLRYVGRFDNGMTVPGVAGRSFLIAGQNSFATDTPYDTGEDSGLQTDSSDWVGSLGLNTNRGLLAYVSSRIDGDDLSPNRLEAQLIGLSGPLTTALTYAFVRKQPDYGLDEDRQELQASGSLRLDENWRAFGSVRFDLVNEEVVRHAFGVAYDAEEFSVSLSYAEDRSTEDTVPDRTVYLRLGLRTLGDASTSIDGNN